MKEIYLKLWESAKPYYEKGRVWDIPHIEWFMKEVERISEIEELNEEVLMPIAILHDVGYCFDSKNNPSIKCQNSKKLHMERGAELARGILGGLNYEPDLIEEIVYCISVHDNWVFGDDRPFKESREMAIFNDLDFLWSLSSYEMFELQGGGVGKEPWEMCDFWMNDEKLVRRPFACESTKKIFEEFMAARRRDIRERNLL